MIKLLIFLLTGLLLTFALIANAYENSDDIYGIESSGERPLSGVEAAEILSERKNQLLNEIEDLKNKNQQLDEMNTDLQSIDNRVDDLGEHVDTLENKFKKN